MHKSGNSCRRMLTLFELFGSLVLFGVGTAFPTQHHPLLFRTNHTDRTFFVWRLTPHDLHILVTAPFCCDRKSRAAYAQSFAPWQQATIEITRRDHYYCLFAPHTYIFFLRAHPVRGESHNQRNTTGEVATASYA